MIPDDTMIPDELLHSAGSNCRICALGYDTMTRLLCLVRIRYNDLKSRVSRDTIRCDDTGGPVLDDDDDSKTRADDDNCQWRVLIASAMILCLAR